MKKIVITGGILLFLIIAVAIIVDASRPKPIDWKPTYAVKDKGPLGLYVFEKEAGTLFKGQKIQKFSNTPYEYLEQRYNYDAKKYTIKGTFLAVDEAGRIDAESVKELLFFAGHGNTVFLSMKDFPQVLLDTLGAKVTAGLYLNDSVALSTNNLAKKYRFNEGAGFSHFDVIDTLNTTILGYQEFDTIKQVNFIKVPFESGNFILHTQPAAFSNFHLLKANHADYTQAIASYIPKGTIYWNARQFKDGTVSSSSFRFIKSQSALRWALNLGWISLLIFIFFNAKRKQRIIPVITPLRNTTVEFARTIGNLYYMEGSHHLIIEKKIIYFLEKVRNDYMIDTKVLDNEFVEKLHLKSGNTFEDIQKVVQLINKHRQQATATKADVIEINKAIEKVRP